MTVTHANDTISKQKNPINLNNLILPFQNFMLWQSDAIKLKTFAYSHCKGNLVASHFSPATGSDGKLPTGVICRTPNTKSPKQAKPLSLLRASRKQANLSDIQANWSEANRSVPCTQVRLKDLKGIPVSLNIAPVSLKKAQAFGVRRL